MQSRYIEIEPAECVVMEAREYENTVYNNKMKPFVILFHDKDTFLIHDIGILYRFFSALDDDIRYLDMTQEIFYSHPPDRPCFGDIIQGYLHNSEKAKIGLWVREPTLEETGGAKDALRLGGATGGLLKPVRKPVIETLLQNLTVIENIDGGKTMGETRSKYFFTTMDFINANYLPDYTQSVRYMLTSRSSGGERDNTLAPYLRRHPVMVFSNGNITVELLCYNSTTYIAGRFLAGKRTWVQPTAPVLFPRWVHLLEDKTLKNMFDQLIPKLNFMEKNNYKIVIGGGGASDRLNNFHERNRLEQENMYRFDAETIDEIYSFQFGEDKKKN
jgi:hypothetical protein